MEFSPQVGLRGAAAARLEEAEAEDLLFQLEAAGLGEAEVGSPAVRPRLL